MSGTQSHLAPMQALKDRKSFVKAIRTARRVASGKRVGVACASCKKARVRCDDFRPCRRCVSKESEEDCTDLESEGLSVDSKKVVRSSKIKSEPVDSKVETTPRDARNSPAACDSTLYTVPIVDNLLRIGADDRYSNFGGFGLGRLPPSNHFHSDFSYPSPLSLESLFMSQRLQSSPFAVAWQLPGASLYQSYTTFLPAPAASPMTFSIPGGMSPFSALTSLADWSAANATTTTTTTVPPWHQPAASLRATDAADGAASAAGGPTHGWPSLRLSPLASSD